MRTGKRVSLRITERWQRIRVANKSGNISPKSPASNNRGTGESQRSSINNTENKGIVLGLRNSSGLANCERAMVNIFLFIELLKMTDASATVERLKALEMSNCRFANVLELNKEKIVAQLDCAKYSDATAAILQKISTIEGIVQTNIIAAVQPVHPK
jgi:hypothetical protein